MSTRLIVLGLLQERPYHGYDLKRVMKERHMGEWANVAFGSIYFALRQMSEEGLIAAQTTEKEGNRPSRTVYCITEAGRQAFMRLLRESWQDDRLLQDSMRVCMFFIEQLPHDEALAHVRRRIQALIEGLKHLQSVIDGLPPEAPWTGRCIVDRDSRLIAEDLEWTRSLLADIESGRLGWRDTANQAPAATSHH